MKYIIVEFNKKKYNVMLESDKDIDVDLEDCLKKLNSDELFEYLYNYHLFMFDEINNDSYFDGKTIKSGEDLKKSIEEIKLISYLDGVIYICGEYWCDPEHGFSIKFPNGKFIKSQHSTYEYDRDEGQAVGYIPICTVLGQYSDGL